MRALVAFLLTLIVFLMAQGTGNSILFHLFYILAGILVTSYVWARLSMLGLTVRRELRTTRAQVGREVGERLLVQNRSRWPKLWVEVHDLCDLPGLQARFVTTIPRKGQRREWVRAICGLRGKFTLGPILLRTGDPLGLFHFQQRIWDKAELVVYPATEEIQGFYMPPAELPGGTATRQRTHHITPNVSGVRDYVPGDSFNRIHWPSSARLRRLIVKEFELDPSADVWIVLDMQRQVQRSEIWRGAPPLSPEREVRTSESTEEYAVTAAASLANYFILRQQRNTGLIGWGQRREVISPEREPRQFYRILECLAILRARGDTPLAEVLAAEANRFSRHASLVVITSTTSLDWIQVSLRDLLYGGIHAVAILVDGSSFGGGRGPDRVEAALQVHNVPYYVLRKGQSIGVTLSGATSMVEWQRGGRYALERYRR